MFERLNSRRRKLLWRAFKRTRLNVDILRYIANRLKMLWHNKNKSTVVCHPTNAMIELGNVCNLHCLMCPREYQYGKEMDKGFMPLDKAKAIIDEMLPYMDSIGLTGLGETLLYPHLLEVLKYIKKRKPSVIVTISTNAHFKGYWEKMQPLLPYLDNVQFSVDGVGEVYETIRPNTCFEEISANIEKTVYSAKHIQFMLNFVISKLNYKDMFNVVEFANKNNIHYVNFNCMSIASMPEKSRSYYLFFQSDEFKETCEEVRRQAAAFDDLEVTGLQYPDNGQFHDCNFPWEYPYITWDGYYVPCCGKPFPKLLNFGNVFTDGGVMAVLNSKKAQAFRVLWQKNSAPQFCHNCQLVNF